MLAIDWRRTNPDLQNEQTKVNLQACCRRRSELLEGYTTATTRKVTLKMIKLERRSNFLERNGN